MDKNEYKQELEGLKAELEKAATEKAKEEIAKEMKALQSKFEAQAEEIKNIKAKQGALPVTEKKKKSFSEQVNESLETKAAQLKGVKDGEEKRVAFQVKAAATMTTSNYSGGTQGLTAWDSEFTRVVRRYPFLREIISVRPIGMAGIAWAEQANPDPGAAGMTAEGAAKTQTDFDMVERRETPKKITVYSKVSKEALDDIAYLSAEINQELVELIQLKLDEQILSGDNTGQNLKGILTYAPAFSVSGTGLATAAGNINDANRFDVLRAAVWQIANSGKGRYVPNYVLLNPIDAALLDLKKDTTNAYILPPFYSAGGAQIAGLKIIENTGVTAGDFLVGDFSKSVLGIREDINISIGYENDDFTKNLITILAEMRAFHFIKTNHNTAFVKGTFSTAMAAMESA